MSGEDFFGLSRERKISKSGVREVFTPHMPINKVELFFGRRKEVQNIIEQINTPGQHSLLYGERGVGKSSLAFVASHFLKSLLKVYYYRCDSSTTFETILAKALKDAGIDVTIKETDSTHNIEKKIDVKVPILGAGWDDGREISEIREGPAGKLSPSQAAGSLGGVRALQVIDEADRLGNPADKLKIAEFIKILSDSDSKFKILVVGVAETGGQLIENHESISRCLRETSLRRMLNDELKP